MKLQHIMETTHVIEESVKAGWLNWLDTIDWEHEVHHHDHVVYETYLDEDEKVFLSVDVHLDVDSRQEDHGYGHTEAWGIPHNHVHMVLEGDVKVVNIELNDEQYSDRKTLKTLGQFLRVPGRYTTDIKQVTKYFFHGMGGKKAAVKFFNDMVGEDESLVNELISDHDQYRQDMNAPDYDDYDRRW